MKKRLAPPGYTKLFYAFAILASVHSVSLIASTSWAGLEEFALEHTFIVLAFLVYLLVASSAFTFGAILIWVLPMLFRVARITLVEVSHATQSLNWEASAHTARQASYSVNFK